MPHERPGWDQYWLGVAKAVSARADCSRRQVGAVIVDSSNRLISSGYNGSPPGDSKSCLAGACPRGRSDVAPGSSYDTGAGACIALHAEQNAIIWASPERLRHSTLYCTDEPCDGCARLIRGVGITKVRVPSGGAKE